MKPEALQQLRIDAGITQTQAARLIWVTPRTWQRYEAGDTKISKAALELFKVRLKENK